MKQQLIEILLQPFPHTKGWRLTEKSACWFATQILTTLLTELSDKAQPPRSAGYQENNRTITIKEIKKLLEI